ncbi:MULTISPECIES: SH3 domain-containing protein [unclassified Sphingobacterium]|uniref:SH3 domain-containing protein n=1 Tax=unclassified Sphingobacterium TaxID=2609468 RepID=UPI0025FE20D9|nr:MULTISPECIES: SH3 domain-containing protein [unclassified Sphingobacterium]
MKTLLPITFALLLVCASACGNSQKTTNTTVQDTTVRDSSVVAESDDEGIPIDFDSTKVLKTTTVTDRSGAELKQQANEQSKKLGRYTYGTRLEVIEENDKWYGVRDRITRNHTKDGQEIETTRWEKVYVLKSKTGSMKEITLVPGDLDIISLWVKNEKSEYFENGKQLKEYLKIELIDKSLFESKKQTAVNFLLADTTKIQKKNGVIELKTQNKTVRFTDKPDAEEDMQIFKYEGQIEALNSYLISGSYYESMDYRLIDKTSGEEKQVFGEFPYISPDKKHIISIYANPYESTGDFELYTITDKRIKQVISVSFKNWMPAVDPGELFWSNDGYIYLTANHVNSFWMENGQLNNTYQYLRIKVL